MRSVFCVLMLLALMGAGAWAQSDTEDPPTAPEPVEDVVADEAVAEAVEEIVDDAATPGLPPEKSERVRRMTISLWSTQVSGKPYNNFTNEESARTIQNMLTDALGEIHVFKVVNREDINAALSEHNLELSGRAEDTSTTALREAGKLAKVNYFLKCEITNYETLTQLRAYLIDVERLEIDRPDLQQRLEVPFNERLLELRNSLNLIVGRFAEQFPLEVDLASATDTSVELSAGTDDGIGEDNEVSIVLRSDGLELARGYVVSATPSTSRVRIEEGSGVLDPAATVARVKLLQPSQAALRRGERYLEAQRYQEALEAFDKGLIIDDKSGELYAGKARALFRLGQTKDALAAFRRALAYRPADRALLEDATRARFEAGLFTELIDSLAAQDVAQLPSSVGVYLGMAYDMIGRNQSAEDVYRAVARVAPNDPRVSLRLAIRELQEGDVNMAERHLGKARDLDPGFTEGQLALEVFNGDNAGVEEARDVGEFVALATSAEILLEGTDDRWADAISLSRDSLAISPGYVRARLIEARALFKGGRADEALERLAEARQEYPENFAVVWLSAKLMATGESSGEALKLLQRASELAPDDPRPAELRGQVFFEQDQYLAAVGEYQEALKLSGDAGKENVELQFRLGQAQALGQQYSKAIEPLERCAYLAPNKAECQYYLGLSQFMMKQPDDAFSHFRAANGIEERHYFLAQIHEGRTEINEATVEYRECANTSNAYDESCWERLIDLETITAKIVDFDEENGIAMLDVGEKHGVELEMVAYVVDVPKTQITISEINPTGSKGEVSNGKQLKLVGRKVRFRPSRPMGLEVRKAQKKGVTVTWQRNPEVEVTQFILYRSTQSTDILQEELKRLKVSSDAQQVFDDKSAKPGNTYYYTVVALSQTGMMSLEANPQEIRVP